MPALGVCNSMNASGTYIPAPPAVVGNALQCPFLDLSEHILEQVGHATLANGARDALRLCQACQTLKTKLKTVRVLAELQRITWVADLTAEHIAITDEGRALTVVGCNDRIEPWATGRLLPTVGKSAWKVCVERSKCGDGNGICIGVCDADARCCWGLFLYSGRLRCITRDEDGQLDYESPPECYPNGNYNTIVMKDEAGQRLTMQGRANGVVIEVIVDHDAGTFGYCINGGTYLPVFPLASQDGKPKTFPKGAALRPYASCYYLGDRLMLLPRN